MNILEMKFNEVPENLRHLHPEATSLVCNKCGRRSFGKIHKDCDFPNPNGIVCKGVIIGLTQKQIEEFRTDLF